MANNGVAETAAKVANKARRAMRAVGNWQRRLSMLSQIGLWVGLTTTAIASCSSCSSFGEIGKAAGAAVQGYGRGVESAGELAESLDRNTARMGAYIEQLEWVPAIIHEAVEEERDAATELAAARLVEIRAARIAHEHEVDSMGAMIDSHAAAYHEALGRAETAEELLAVLVTACTMEPPDVVECLAAIEKLKQQGVTTTADR